ncbi:TetR/AcrR family transcriptional regulator [Actinomadura craniellae]|nr:TetR/AcrR family transcriptional regulator [Actinomadura craniellae]
MGRATSGPRRLARSDRQEVLLQAAAELVAAGPADAVSIEAVAERAGVSRPLVYKHFANRDDLLSAVYRREAALLHARLAEGVGRASTVEEMFRILVHGLLRAQAERGAVRATLRAGGGAVSAARRDQRGRNRATVRYFTARAVAEYDLDPVRAGAAVTLALSALETVLTHWCHDPTPERARTLEDAYVALAVGGLTHLAQTAPRPRE